MTSKDTSISSVLKIYKTIYKLFLPLFCVVLVATGILCFFKSAEGSNSGSINLVIFIVSLVLIIVMWLLNKNFEKRSYGYCLYHQSWIAKLNLETNLPLWITILVVAIPFYILLITSLKGTVEANHIEFTWWPTKGFDVESYKELFTRAAVVGLPMGKAMLNSFVYAIIPTTIGLFVSALSAYAFAKLEFKGKKLLYTCLIMTMMMPGCVTMTTAYIMYDTINWVNTPLPIIVPGCLGAAATVMFLREYFMGIPNGLLEAAKIDGAGKWKCFFTLMLPLGKPALIAQFIMGFISAYNNYVGPLIYINNPDGYTIQIAINALSGPFPDQAVTASAGVFAVAPMLLLYAIFQKQIVEGISMSSGLKG